MLSHLPFHPFTGLQALGFTSRGPVWPVMGGSQPNGEPQVTPPAPPPVPGPPAQQQPKPSDPPPATPDKGFPEGTPLDQMTGEQREAYWKHYARKHEGEAKGFTALGMTPEQVAQMQARNEELESKDLSAGEKAVKDAAKEAATKAQADTEAVWKPKYQTAMLRAVASPILSGDQDKLNAFLAITDPAKFSTADGEIDAELVRSHLTALYGQAPPAGPNGQQQQPGPRDWGQHGGPPPATQPGQSGRAEAEKRKARQGA